MSLDYNPIDDYDTCDDCGLVELKTDLNVCPDCLDVLCDACTWGWEDEEPSHGP
jgi:hypothetical protein